MSNRYLAGFVQAGLFNPLIAPTPTYFYNLYSWGSNNFGQLGLGNITNYSSPKQVGTLTDWLSVTAAGYRASATKTGGTLWSWGYNAQGQLGLGNRTNYSSPKQVGSLTTWLNITAGHNCTIATTS